MARIAVAGTGRGWVMVDDKTPEGERKERMMKHIPIKKAFEQICRYCGAVRASNASGNFGPWSPGGLFGRCPGLDPKERSA